MTEKEDAQREWDERREGPYWDIEDIAPEPMSAFVREQVEGDAVWKADRALQQALEEQLEYEARY